MNSFNKKKILVVGGAGFVGSNLVKRLLQEEPSEIIIVDNLLSAEKENIPNSNLVTFIHETITNDVVLNSLPKDIDYVFHLATYHGNQSSIHDPLADHENNTLTTLKLFNKLSSGFNNLKKVVYSSAGCTVAEKTFDDAEATTEDSPVSLYLDSPYQISKIIGEFYANYYFKQYGLPVVKARFQNVYGPGEILGAGQWRGTPATIWRNVVPTFIYRALKQMPLTVENNGIATRDFIYIDDIVEGLVLCATIGESGEVYNLASGQEMSILDLANTINEITSNLIPIQFLPKRNWDYSGKRFGSTDKAKNVLNFISKVDLNDGLAQTIEWTNNNFDFIDQCVSRYMNYIPNDNQV